MGKERTKFDESKDVTLGSWEFGSLRVKVAAYDDGQPKLQLGPRIYQDEETGQDKFGKCGRLTAKEVSWLRNTVLAEASVCLGLSAPAVEEAVGGDDNIPF